MGGAAGFQGKNSRGEGFKTKISGGFKARSGIAKTHGSCLLRVTGRRAEAIKSAAFSQDAYKRPGYRRGSSFS
jgi:hypothetical protein